MVGNGICDDETNTAVCNYDDGDCCLNGDKNFVLNSLVIFKRFVQQGFILRLEMDFAMTVQIFLSVVMMVETIVI